MRAWICKKWGGPNDLSLGDLTEPVCTDRSVKIRADAWGVNFADLVLIAGQYQARPSFPFAPGMVSFGCGGRNQPRRSCNLGGGQSCGVCRVQWLRRFGCGTGIKCCKDTEKLPMHRRRCFSSSFSALISRSSSVRWHSFWLS